MPPAPGQRRAGVREDPRTVSRGLPLNLAQVPWAGSTPAART